MANQDPVNPAHTLFDLFVQAQRCVDVKQHFAELCRQLTLNPKDFRNFYSKLKERLNYWKAKSLWTKLDKRASHSEYQQRKACIKNKCLVLGAGPCGLRTAIELSFLGAQVVVVEKRESFSRNNVLHLWPFSISDLRGLGAKTFHGKFCTGSLDHISIRQLQLILLKVALLLGVEVHTGVEFLGLNEPSGENGWMAKLKPETHPAATFQFDVLVSAGGGRFVPDGFKHKELRGKLAIGITANFINRKTAAEAQVPEISGVARIYNQKFFQQLLSETGIDLENIVYYKDDTHYFVMTAKKKSLLEKGVIKEDHSDAEQLLAPSNVDYKALHLYAHDAAQFSTGGNLPHLQFAQNHLGQPDVAMFDFTCMYRAENASLIRERRGKKLLTALVGDCLVEPFWPLGTGIARGFLASFDTAWMVRSWGLGVPHLKVLAERESVYQILSQTTPENTSKNYGSYTINPRTRYVTVNLSSIHTNQVRTLYLCNTDSASGIKELLAWCQKNTAGYNKVNVNDFSQSWRSGLALCALVHRFRPHLIDMSSLDESNAVYNNQTAFSILEKELGIPPVMSARDMASNSQIDNLSMVFYLTQIQEAFNVSAKAKASGSRHWLCCTKQAQRQAEQTLTVRTSRI
uniref:F-actin monooxygenase n=1 Tax=Takifugu rubripes TaxID=31033 RepID=A0A674NML6_TAKRU